MRHLHDEAAGILEYMSSHGLTVTRRDFQGRPGTTAETADAIEEMLKRSETLWGTALPYYLYISKGPEGGPLALKQAVVEIEAAAEPERFLVVAYQDGGVISVSGTVLPFQRTARDAAWWAPY
jgi:hypothetical protein